MANRWCDGFGRYGGDEAKMLNGSSSQAWAQVDTGASGWALSNANPRTGNWALRLTDGIMEPQARRVFGAPLTEVFIGMALHFEELPSVELADDSGAASFWLASLRDASNAMQFGITLGTDGAICAWRGAFGIGGWDSGDFNGTLLGRTVPIIGAGAYQHVEFYAKAGNGDGAIEIRVDEVTRLNLTGIDTVTSANIEFSQWVIGRSGTSAFTSGTHTDLADVYCNDTIDDGSGCNDFIGDCKSGCLMVNADTAQADFDLSTGALGYALLDETPPNDADYISTASTTAESDFGLENGPANLTEILTTRPFVRAWKDDAGTCTIAPSMISNSEKAAVSSQPIATSASYYDSNVPLDPDTGAPWTASALDAAFEAVERTA